MARALIVGCGCRGRALAAALSDAGWAVRGTSRTEHGVAAIEAAGFDGVRADPERVGTVLDHVHDVAVVCWLLASARGERGEVGALHGPRLERLLEELVDTPVRGFVYEARGDVPAALLERGVGAVRAAEARWHIPAALIESDPGDARAWTAAAIAAVERALGSR